MEGLRNRRADSLQPSRTFIVFEIFSDMKAVLDEIRLVQSYNIIII